MREIEDVSFTFLHRVEEVEWNVEDSRWQSALALALTLPDICGGIAFPDLVKRYRNGRIVLDRQKNPARDVGGQYVGWFDTYAADFFKLSPEDTKPYISGERCWQLRCEYLHQNKGFLNDEKESADRFHLGVNCVGALCTLDWSGIQKETADTRIDIEQFCLRMCRAARHYYNSVYQEKDFTLYNTPVLDFIQVKHKTENEGPQIVIICENPVYAKGLRLALQPISAQIFLFSDISQSLKQTENRKPVVWIVTESLLKQAELLSLEEKLFPVIVISKNAGEEQKRTLLTMPVRPEVLRNAVRFYISDM